ncbi:MAG TPA: hypothetical protein PLR06_02715 [Cyclobacteriaceae bacterium]|nr:hypothetical protein [Cyclobacteriaceae bacterium]
MKRISVAMMMVLGTALLMVSCQQSEVVSQFTGNEVTYALQQGSTFAVSGSVVFKERKDGKVSAVISLAGTDGNGSFPVHLHLGDISTQKADIALLMNPVDGKTGKSETVFSSLSDESAIDYNRLTQMNACIKIHLGDSGPDRDVILVAGNIGTATTPTPTGGRLGIAVCKSE